MNIWLPVLVAIKSRYAILARIDVGIIADTPATDFRREGVTVGENRREVPTFPDRCGTQVSWDDCNSIRTTACRAVEVYNLEE